MMIEIVKEYGDEIPAVIKKLKDLHTGDEDREKAEMIFSTVHRAKGMEYDVVHLVSDFQSETQLERKIRESKEEKIPVDAARLNEEINLLYVAVTRARRTVYVPESILPKGFPVTPNVQVVRSEKEQLKPEAAPAKKSKYDRFTRTRSTLPTGPSPKEKKLSVERKRESYKEAYSPWTPELDSQLRELYLNTDNISKISEELGRTRGAILSRLKKLNYFGE
jgi:superfamily I DNA/RNA helicase